jgi:hypothetical protein
MCIQAAYSVAKSRAHRFSQASRRPRVVVGVALQEVLSGLLFVIRISAHRGQGRPSPSSLPDTEPRNGVSRRRRLRFSTSSQSVSTGSRLHGHDEREDEAVRGSQSSRLPTTLASQVHLWTQHLQLEAPREHGIAAQVTCGVHLEAHPHQPPSGSGTPLCQLEAPSQPVSYLLFTLGFLQEASQLWSIQLRRIQQRCLT